MSRYISIHIKIHILFYTHYLSFTENFTNFSELPTTTNATLSPTTVNNIEFNPVNSVSVYSVSLGFLGEFYATRI